MRAVKFYRSTMAVALLLSALSTELRGDFSGPYSVPTQTYPFKLATTDNYSGGHMDPGYVRLDNGFIRKRVCYVRSRSGAAKHRHDASTWVPSRIDNDSG